MKITPLEIQQQQFKTKIFGGLDDTDVDTFLQLIASEMEDMIRENTDLKEQLKKATIEIDEHRLREVSLREAMLAAQRVIEEMKANTQKESTLIISEAELKAEQIVAEAEKRLMQLNGQIQELRREKIKFETAMKSILETHYKLLTLPETKNEQ
jgi:cell division initiation protein